MATLRETLRQATGQLRHAGVPSPEVDARELVLHALGLNRTALLTQAARELTDAEFGRVQALTGQRAARVPLQHLLGEVEWGGLRLKVDRRALVPRPETEVLLELALKAARENAGGGPSPTILDIGTGTGALAVALKHALPDADVTATDLSAEALELARENAGLNSVNLTFVQGSLFAGLNGPFGLIVSNPPYLPASDRATADPELRHDPDLALYSGPDGLTLARELVREAPTRLAPGGTLLLELDPRNVTRLAAEMPAWDTEILPDLTGRQRFLRAVRRA